MMLIVILNTVLALAIVGVIVALHSHAIVRDHRHHHGDAPLWASRARPARAASPAPPAAAPAERRTQRPRPAAVLD